MSVSLIIPTRNQHQILDQALQSIMNARLDGLGPIDIIVVDNQSDNTQSQQFLAQLDSSPALNQSCSISVLPFDEPFNYSKINNLAATQAKGEIYCFLNNDIEVISSDWLIQLTQSARQPSIGCSGALLFYPNDTVQHAGVVLGMGTIAGHAYTGLDRSKTQIHPYFQQPRDCSAVTGACIAVSRENFNQVNGFDETLPVAFNDVDFCLKIKKLGLTNRFLPQVQLYHHESLSRGKGIKSEAAKERHKNDIQMLKKRWGKEVSEDSYWLELATKNNLASLPQFSSTSRLGWKKKPKCYLHKDLV